jgi:hypothetical protein
MPSDDARVDYASGGTKGEGPGLARSLGLGHCPVRDHCYDTAAAANPTGARKPIRAAGAR